MKNLWALRLQLLKDSVDAISNDDNLFSSQPQIGESEAGIDRRPHKKKLDKAMPSLIDSLGICYFGMVLLRMPIGIGELLQWAIREDMPFIRAIRYVPADIKEKLPAEYIMALDTTSAPELDQIRDAVNNLGRFYSHHFTIVLPPLNAPLLLFKLIKRLALPISVFSIVRRLAALLSIDFRFPRPRQRQLASSSPEASLMSLLIIGVKLHHPFDDLPRSAVSFNDPAVLKIDWSKWVEAQKSHESRIQAGSYLARGSEMNILEEDVMRMSGEQMDDYLNWYERTWIDEDRAQHKHRPLNKDFRKWFPTASRDHNDSSSATLAYVEQVSQESGSAEQFSMDVIGTLQMRNVSKEPGAEGSGVNEMTIGSCYRRYRTRQDLTSQALLFHEVAANATGLSLETLLRAIMQIEGRLIKWRRARPIKGKEKDTGGELQSAVSDNDPGESGKINDTG